MNKQSNKSTLMLKSLLKDFYNDNNNRLQVANIINRKCVYSCRTLEWFCITYSKTKSIKYKMKNNKMFNVYKSYKDQLKKFQKKGFDPFKRDNEGFSSFSLKYIDKQGNKCDIDITVGQLTFFKWCIENEILEYITTHIDTIKTEMKKDKETKK